MNVDDGKRWQLKRALQIIKLRLFFFSVLNLGKKEGLFKEELRCACFQTAHLSTIRRKYCNYTETDHIKY